MARLRNLSRENVARRRRIVHLKCFCWAKNICKPLIFLFQIINTSMSGNISSVPPTLCRNSLSRFLCSFFLSPSSPYTDLYVLETSFFLPINCFLHNLPQQLKFFRCRLEIVVLCATRGFYFISPVRVVWIFVGGRKLLMTTTIMKPN